MLLSDLEPWRKEEWEVFMYGYYAGTVNFGGGRRSSSFGSNSSSSDCVSPVASVIAWGSRSGGIGVAAPGAYAKP